MFIFYTVNGVNYTVRIFGALSLFIIDVVKVTTKSWATARGDGVIRYNMSLTCTELCCECFVTVAYVIVFFVSSV